jgi:L,D-transpeptidase YcbB
MIEIDKKCKQGIYFLFSIFLCQNLQSCKNNTSLKKLNTENISNLFSKDKYDPDEAVKNLFAQEGVYMFNTDTFSTKQALASMYDSSRISAIWVDGNGLSENGKTLKSIIDSIESQGFNPQQFWIDSLKLLENELKKQPSIANASKTERQFAVIAYKLAKSLKNGYYTPGSFTQEYYNQTDSNFNPGEIIKKIIVNDSLKFITAILEPKLPLYQKLKEKLKALKAIKAAGGWITDLTLKDSIANGTTGEQIIKLRKRLNKELGTPKDTISNTMDDGLLADIKMFQHLYDLKTTGKIDTSTLRRLNTDITSKINIIKTNMERCRWLKSELKQPYIWVNVPKMELSYINNDSLAYQMRVVVGRSGRPTPTLDALMTNLVINPGWSVPPTIMEQEIIPGIAKRGGSYLAIRGLKAFLGGREVNPGAINLKNYKRYSIQQKPGLNSALGVVKFNMPNRHAIYLHDTPHREDFVKYNRAYSSGCIRVHHPREFAAFLLNDSNYTQPKIDSFIKRKTPKEVPLKNKVDVHIVYITNDLDSMGNVKFLRDIYNYDKNFYKVWDW